MKRLLFISFTFIIFAVVGLVRAEDTSLPNDPTVNTHANACFDGGSKAGTCFSDIEWLSGWYLIRLETEFYTYEDIPDWLYWMLPADYLDEDINYEDKVAKSKKKSASSSNCYARPEGDWSFTVSKINTNNNLTWYHGSECSGDSNGNGTLVSASNQTDAATKCGDLGEPGWAEEMDNYGASGYYLCNSG